MDGGECCHFDIAGIRCLVPAKFCHVLEPPFFKPGSETCRTHDFNGFAIRQMLQGMPAQVIVVIV